MAYPEYINNIVENYELAPHPEGGFFRETYRSEFSTGIFYLLVQDQKSSLHRIKSDEMWHFYAGDAIAIVELTSNGSFKETLLDMGNVQHVVSANTWFGAYLPDGAAYALTGCTVAPAFHFQDFEMGNKEALLKEFPKAKKVIEKLL